MDAGTTALAFAAALLISLLVAPVTPAPALLAFVGTYALVWLHPRLLASPRRASNAAAVGLVLLGAWYVGFVALPMAQAFLDPARFAPYPVEAPVALLVAAAVAGRAALATLDGPWWGPALLAVVPFALGAAVSWWWAGDAWLVLGTLLAQVAALYLVLADEPVVVRRIRGIAVPMAAVLVGAFIVFKVVAPEGASVGGEAAMGVIAVLLLGLLLPALAATLRGADAGD